MSAAKQKGTNFESFLAKGFSQFFDDPLERVVLHGREDQGDLWVPNTRGLIVVEAKNRRQMALAEWVDEAQVEAGNVSKTRNVLGGVVVHKRRGTAQFWDQYVSMRMDTFCRIAGLS